MSSLMSQAYMTDHIDFCSVSKLFDNLVVFLKYVFETAHFEYNESTKHDPACKELNLNAVL